MINFDPLLIISQLVGKIVAQSHEKLFSVVTVNVVTLSAVFVV